MGVPVVRVGFDFERVSMRPQLSPPRFRSSPVIRLLQQILGIDNGFNIMIYKTTSSPDHFNICMISGSYAALIPDVIPQNPGST
jgi:hypothetical protein